MPKISFDEALQRIQAWNQIRLRRSTVSGYLDTINYFETDSDFNIDLYTMESVLHIYLGIDNTTDPDQSTLQLLVLGRNADANSAAGESTPNHVYVFNTQLHVPPQAEQTIEPDSDGGVKEMDVQMAEALIQFWDEQRNSWVEDVIRKGDGPPQVFDAPSKGIVDLYHQSTQYNSEKRLFVFFGLRGIPYPALDIDLIFTPASDLSQLNATQTVRDFTSPKPPFGTSGIANYGLLNVSLT